VIPDPANARLVDCISHTARVLTGMAKDLAAREYTAEQAIRDIDELEATGLIPALREFADKQS